LFTVHRKKKLCDNSMSTIGRDREGLGHILVLKNKVPASFNQLLRDGSIPNHLLRDGSFCNNTCTVTVTFI
jgi:hypothetical protein